MNIRTTIILCMTFAAFSISAQPPEGQTDKVTTTDLFEDLYIYGDFYISAQPEVELLTWSKDQGITTIINLRSEEEKTDFEEEEYDEKFVAEKLGFSYFELPVDGFEDFTPRKQESFNELLDPQQPTLIHCASGRRATFLFMIYLVQEQGYTLQEAVKIGKQMKYSSPLEQLLDKEILLEIATEQESDI